jgi:hypothetical protein
MRAITWAIRVQCRDGRSAFLRPGGLTGRGPIRTFQYKDDADGHAEILREALDAGDSVTVIERSHGKHTAHPETPTDDAT